MAVFAGNGSASAPSFTFSSDTDLGMFRVGANELAFSSNNQRIFQIGATYAGVGTANPVSQGLDREFYITAGTTATARAGLTMQAARNSNGTIISQAFYNGATQVAGIEAIRAGADDAGNITFFTKATSTALGEIATMTGDKYLRMASATGGIQFNGDTAAANALDDYEEGTWTPTVVSGFFSTTNLSVSGTYTKIGNIVIQQARIQHGANSNMTIDTSAITEQNRTSFITGLPFGMQQTASTTSVRLYSWGAQGETKGLQAGIYPAGSFNNLSVSQTSGSVTGYFFVFTLVGRIY